MPAGRHRSFDKEKALEAATLVFWRNGYTGSSLADLTQAMGINKPSLYAAFGNKEQLFVAALEQYANQHAHPALEHLFAPNQSLAQRLETHFRTVARIFCDPNLPTGCLVANSTVESAGDNMPQTAFDFISNFNEGTKQRLIDFFVEEQANGTLNSPRSPRTLALYFISANSGLATLARTGATLAELDAVIMHIVSTFA